MFTEYEASQARSQDAPQYRIVFCDIDGTLLDSNNRIPLATGQKIRELCDNGIPFVLVSARMPSGVLPLRAELGVEAPAICYSGALILNERGESVKSVGIGRDIASYVYGFIKKGWRQVSCGVFSHDYWIVDDTDDKRVVREREITSSAAVAGEIADFVPSDGVVHKLLCMGEAGQIAEVEASVKKKYPELTVYRSKDTYLEIMSGAASKSGAVRYICERYGISIDSAVSFGDNYNDVDMLLATGAGFAMGNAPEGVKSQAAYVTLDNDSEGVLAGLNRMNFAKALARE